MANKYYTAFTVIETDNVVEHQENIILDQTVREYRSPFLVAEEKIMIRASDNVHNEIFSMFESSRIFTIDSENDDLYYITINKPDVIKNVAFHYREALKKVDIKDFDFSEFFKAVINDVLKNGNIVRFGIGLNADKIAWNIDNIDILGDVSSLPDAATPELIVHTPLSKDLIENKQLINLNIFTITRKENDGIYVYVALDTPIRFQDTFKVFLMELKKENKPVFFYFLPPGIYQALLMRVFHTWLQTLDKVELLFEFHHTIAKEILGHAERSIESFKTIVDKALQMKFNEIKFRVLHQKNDIPQKVNIYFSDGTQHVFYKSEYLPIYYKQFLSLIENVDITLAQLLDKPYDFSITIGNQDLRVATIPIGRTAILARNSGILAPSMTVRIRTAQSVLDSLYKMGHAPTVYPRFALYIMPNQFSPRPVSGAIYLAGEMHSGKSTFAITFQKMLFNKGVVDVFAMEDPIEEVVEEFSQFDLSVQAESIEQIEEKKRNKALAFVKSVLRHDPSLINVGEIRDADMLSAFIQIALSGKPSMATIHAPNLPSIFDKLNELKASPEQMVNVTTALVFLTLLPAVQPKYLIQLPLFDKNGKPNRETMARLEERLEELSNRAIYSRQDIEKIKRTYLGPYYIYEALLEFVMALAVLVEHFRADGDADGLAFARRWLKELLTNPKIYLLNETKVRQLPKQSLIYLSGKKVQAGSFWLLTAEDKAELYKIMKHGISHKNIRIIARRSDNFVSMDEELLWNVITGAISYEHAIDRLVKHQEIYPFAKMSQEELEERLNVTSDLISKARERIIGK